MSGFESSITSSRWAITFADVVTLILAFFVVTMTSSPGPASQASGTTGTTLAVHPLEPVARHVTQRLSIEADDVDLLTGVLSKQGRERLKEFVMSIDYSTSSITLGACSGLYGPGVPGPTELSMRRQFIDRGVPASRLRLSALPITCVSETAQAELVVEREAAPQLGQKPA